jgi:O-antigen/teichoic acid export membrane protein
MGNIRSNRISKIAVRALILSVVLILLSRLVVEILFKAEFSEKVEEVVYSACYVIIFASFFLLLVSLVALLLQFLAKPKSI